MKLTVNGEACSVSSTTLAALLQELDYEHDFLATACNGEMVPAEERDTCVLAEGDQVEILSPMQGG